jgi:hypothetical protein
MQAIQSSCLYDIMLYMLRGDIEGNDAWWHRGEGDGGVVISQRENAGLYEKQDHCIEVLSALY